VPLHASSLAGIQVGLWVGLGGGRGGLLGLFVLPHSPLMLHTPPLRRPPRWA
jgi:hypothetical protein